MNISKIQPDLVNAEFTNPANIGSIYLMVTSNPSFDPPRVNRTFNELIGADADGIHFKYFTGGLHYPGPGGVEHDVIFPDQYYNPNEGGEIDIYKINFLGIAEKDIMKLVQSFGVTGGKKIDVKKTKTKKYKTSKRRAKKTKNKK
jgi:hypothetical protein